jgi:hypothetical protein
VSTAGDSLLTTVQQVNAIVTGQGSANGAAGAAAAPGGSAAPPSATAPTPTAQASGIVVQSVAQSAAMMVQDAATLFRNLSTIETTAIGIATAKWIETPENVAYLLVIEESQRVIQSAAALIETASKSAHAALQAFGGGNP